MPCRKSQGPWKKIFEVATIVTPDTLMRWHKRQIATTDFLSVEV
ncbi:MAG: hypothetical protein ACI9F9_002198 [Candidatus Paceibacteria bacterium]|jgi:hypothetical protein